MFYIFMTEEQMDIRLSPTRAASAIRRVFGHKVTIDKCVYATKNTVIYTATGNIRSRTAFGGIIQISSEGMLSSTITNLVVSGNQTLQRKLADFTAMLGRLGFYDSSYMRYKTMPVKNVVEPARKMGPYVSETDASKTYTLYAPTVRYSKQIKVKDKLRLKLGRLTVGGLPDEGIERTVDLSIQTNYSCDVRHSYLMGCLLHYQGRMYSNNVLSDFLNEMFEKYGQLSAAKKRSTPC